MKVLVIGATGTVGRKTLDALLTEGHHVTGFGRSIDKINQPRANLSVIKGDVTDASDVEAAVPGQDVVILTFGAAANLQNFTHQPDVCEDGTRKVVAAMKKHGVNRLVCQTSLGAGDSAGHGGFMFRNIIEPVLLGRIMKDRTAQEEVVRASDLAEWVIVRPTELSDGDGATVRVITDLDAEPEPSTISRKDVAKFLTRTVVEKTWDGRAVTITN